MITFRPMSLPVPLSRSLSVLALCAALARPATGQIMLTHDEDASPVPVGSIRFRLQTGWTRYDERFGASGRHALGEDISSPALGTKQLPLLTPAELGIQALSNDPSIRLSLGRFDAKSDVRNVTTPISLEYGLTRRLSVGIMVPIVQTRRNIHVVVNSDTLNNVNFVPARTRGTAANANAAVYAAFNKAADSIATLIAQCPTHTTSPGCGAVNANPAGAAAAANQARRFANAVRSALGTDSLSAFLAPKAGSPLAAAIDGRRIATNTLLQAYLGSGAGALSSVFTTSGSFSYIDLQGRNGVPGLLQGPLGQVDSIQTTNRLVAGGITFAAQYLLHDGFSRDSLYAPRVQTRIAVGAAVRIDRSPADSARLLGAIPASTGSGVVLRTAMDVIVGNLGGTIAARFDKPFARTVSAPLYGDPDSYFVVPYFTNVQRTEGSVINLDLTPRYYLTEWMSLDFQYGFEHTAAPSVTSQSNVLADPQVIGGYSMPTYSARTAQRVGFGFRYSSVDAYMRHRVRTPIEVSFSHLETITGDSGVPALSRDQIQVRLYFGLR